jgi:acetylornithine deacetylase/succinyl-diaminopimelate desuccinylase-like protein
MPHDDNAAAKLAAAVARIGTAPQPARVTPLVRDFLAALGLGQVAELAEPDSEGAAAALQSQVADPVLRRSFDAMLRDTVTPTVLRAGNKVNVIPGTASAELDVRTLPGTDQAELLAQVQRGIGALGQVEAVLAMPAVEAPADAEIVDLMREALSRADPDATAVPMMITPGTDAKALARLGIPTYGFAPLRLAAEVPFLSLFHGNDERIPVSAIAFGLPVLYEVVHRFAAAPG